MLNRALRSASRRMFYLYFLFLPALGASAATTGKITFTGQIVEPPCVLNTLNTVVNVTCTGNGRTSNFTATPNSAEMNIPEAGIALMKTERFNNSANIYMTTVSYN
ncbi:hypothetical protein NKZ99_004225 [Salmonella enterica]|nr:hypothetical protein [Salmonella enterica]